MTRYKINCENCQNEAVLSLIELQTEYDKILKWNKILEKCLDAKEELCKFYCNENEELQNKYRIAKETINNLKKEV